MGKKKPRRTVEASPEAAVAIAEAPDGEAIGIKTLAGVQRFNFHRAIRKAANLTGDKLIDYAIAYIVTYDVDVLAELEKNILEAIGVDVDAETDSADMLDYVEEIAAVLPEALQETISD